jgi:transcriptional regulator with XRE-family HTH domain
MHPIHAGQIKAARAMLDWSQEDLAQATGLAINTIRNLEAGAISPRSATNDLIRQAIEKAGLEFIEREGVRRRLDEIQIHQGVNGCEAFFDDLRQTVHKKGGEIVCLLKSQAMLLESCGLAPGGNLEPLERLSAVTPIKCLVTETTEPALFVPAIPCRALAEPNLSPVPYYVYGDKHALMLPEAGGLFRFVVFRSVTLAQSYRSHFGSLWERSLPVPAAAGFRPKQQSRA